MHAGERQARHSPMMALNLHDCCYSCAMTSRIKVEHFLIGTEQLSKICLRHQELLPIVQSDWYMVTCSRILKCLNHIHSGELERYSHQSEALVAKRRMLPSSNALSVTLSTLQH